jgi:hypothetical protein
VDELDDDAAPERGYSALPSREGMAMSTATRTRGCTSPAPSIAAAESPAKAGARLCGDVAVLGLRLGEDTAAAEARLCEEGVREGAGGRAYEAAKGFVR